MFPNTFSCVGKSESTVGTTVRAVCVVANECLSSASCECVPRSPTQASEYETARGSCPATYLYIVSATATTADKKRKKYWNIACISSLATDIIATIATIPALY